MLIFNLKYALVFQKSTIYEHLIFEKALFCVTIYQNL